MFCASQMPFHDEQLRAGFYHVGNRGQHRDDLFRRKAVQKLTHPTDIDFCG